MGEVKRYDPINSDGTCGMCIEDADYGAYVEYADYAALEAENAKLRAELERRAVDAWIPVSLRLPSSGQLVIASGYRFGKLENGSWVEPAIYEDDDRNFHPPKPGEEGDLVADFDATMIHTNYWMPLPAAPAIAAARKGEWK